MVQTRHAAGFMERLRRHYCYASNAVILLLCAVLSGCAKEDPKSAAATGGFSRQRALPVVAFPAQMESLKETLTAVGTARALRSVTLYPEAAGIVTAVNFSPDAQVEAGELLLQLDSRDERLAVELAKVQLADAKRVLKRFTSVNRTEANIPESQIDQAQATVDANQIALEQAEIALDRRRITAPFAGRVGLTDIDVGDRIDTSQMVTTLDERTQLLVNFPVPESYIGQVRPGSEVTVKLWDGPQGAVDGQVVAVDSRIDANSRAFIARAAVDNRDDQFRPGMAFEIAFSVSRGDYISVPDISVQWGADGPFVWIANEGKATRVPVELVKRLPNRLLLKAAIEPGTDVVAEGVQGVREGLALQLLDASALDQDARLQLAQPAAPADSGAAGGA